jgi:hypothetical protein
MRAAAWTRERVLRYADEWVWLPDGADEVRTEEYHLVAYPAALAVPTHVAWCRSPRPPSDVVEEVIATVRAWGRPDVSFWVSERTMPSDLEDHLRARGAEHVETVDVSALDLTGPPPDLSVPGDVTVRVVDDEHLVRLAARVADEVWGSTTTEDDVRRAVAALAEPSAATTRRVLALVDGEPASTAGLTLDGDAAAARLWGGATRPALRGRGAYRATLAERLRMARADGATLAMVKGVVETSGPILRAAGFTTYGSSRRYRLPVPPP